jgi:hypothetical protein
MPTQDPHWTAYVGTVFGLAGLLIALGTWWRGRRTLKLAEDANQRSIIADDRAEVAEKRSIAAEGRAEEAHTILIQRFTSDGERAQAELDAPGIAEIWAAQVRQGRQNRTEDGGNLFSVFVELPTFAHRRAIELLRAHSKELHISRIGPSGGSPDGKWVILAYTTKAIIRLRLDQ